MQQILVQIMAASQPDWLEDATNRVRVPCLESKIPDDPFRERPDPRIFNTHLPYEVLPQGVKDKQVKVVFVWRNPKDVMVSLYHFSHSYYFLETPRSFEEFVQQFLDGDDSTANLVFHRTLTHEQDPKVPELLHLGKTSFPTRSWQFTGFLLRTMASDLEVLILIPAASHSVCEPIQYKKRNFMAKDKLGPKDLDALRDFELRQTDIFLITFPKSGTAWMQQILVQIMAASQPDWLEDATNRVRVPFLESTIHDDPFRERPDPRIFCSHLPYEMLPQGVKDKQVKVVFVWRNPKDVLVSLYHFSHSYYLLETPQSFEEFFQQFLDGDAYMGSWFDYMSEYYAARDELNIHFVKYENMLKDLRGEVVKICAFLGKVLTDEAIDHVVETSTFKNMKTNPQANYKNLVETDHYKTDPMRKGTAGDWKNFFTVAQNEQFDKVFAENMADFPETITWELEQ